MSKNTQAQEQITELTPEQRAKLPMYYEKFLKIGLSTERADRPMAEAAFTRFYRHQRGTLPGYKDPIFFWVDSPFAGAKKSAQEEKGSLDVALDEIKSQADKANYGSFDAYWVAFYSFVAKELPVTSNEVIDIAEDVVKSCGPYWLFEDAVVCSEKPSAIVLDSEGKLHNPSGMALQYPDGKGLYAIHGQTYPTLIEARMAAEAQSSEEEVG